MRVLYVGGCLLYFEDYNLINSREHQTWRNPSSELFLAHTVCVNLFNILTHGVFTRRVFICIWMHVTLTSLLKFLCIFFLVRVCVTSCHSTAQLYDQSIVSDSYPGICKMLQHSYKSLAVTAHTLAFRDNYTSFVLEYRKLWKTQISPHVKLHISFMKHFLVFDHEKQSGNIISVK